MRLELSLGRATAAGSAPIVDLGGTRFGGADLKREGRRVVQAGFHWRASGDLALLGLCHVYGRLQHSGLMEIVPSVADADEEVGQASQPTQRRRVCR